MSWYLTYTQLDRGAKPIAVDDVSTGATHLNMRQVCQGQVPQASSQSLPRQLDVVRCRYAWAAISEWQCQQGVTQQGMLGSEVVLSGPTALRRSHSMSCMTQLQAKHSGTPFDQLDGAAG